MDSKQRNTGPFEIAPPLQDEFDPGGLFGRIGRRIGQAADVLGGSTGIIDLTAKADKSLRKGTRDMAQVKALVLHQMACCRQRKDPLNSYLRINSHYAILADGRILQLHPESAMLWASNGFNHGGVAVEFAGNFPNTKGKWWQGDKYGRDHVSPAQLDAGRRLVRHLIAKIGLRVVVAHRQSSASRENDPGPDIWYHVGQWAVDTLGMGDGGPGFKVDDGHSIPDLWRTWGSSQQTGRAVPAAAAGPSAAASATKQDTKAPTVDVRPYRPLLPLLEKYRGDAPLAFLLGWIAVESGGDIRSTTRLDERGYFQLHPDESKALGVDHARLSTDADYSIQQGIALARYQANKVAKQYGYPPGSALTWPLSKLLHWLPLGVQVIMDMMKNQGRRASTWDELRSFVLAQQEAIQKEITRRDLKHRSWPPARGIANVDKVLQRGHEIAQALGRGAAPQHESSESDAVFENEFEQETAFGPLTARLGWLPRAYPYAAVAARGSVFENFGGVYIAFVPAPAGGKPKILKVGMSDTFARRMRDAKYVAWNRSHPGLSFYLAQVHGQRDRYGVAGVTRMVEYALARLLRRAGELTGPQLPNQPSAARGAVQIANILPTALQALLAPALRQSRAGGSAFNGSMAAGQLALPTGFRWEAERAAAV
jgi:hypothetical protein